MAFNWKEFLELSKFLQNCDEDCVSKETKLRSAISRAYFSAFCHARNYARDKEKYVPQMTAEDHKTLRQHFIFKKRMNIANHLQDLRNWRNDCDYHDDVDNMDIMTNKSIDKASNILRIC